MSLEQVCALLRAARDSAAFATQLAEAPSILTGYDLTREEREALVGHDVERLRELGVPEELMPGVKVIGRTDR